jgi:hypothetical protein
VVTYPRLTAYIKGMYEESGAKEGGWSDEEVVTDLMRFDAARLVQAEESLGLFSVQLCHDMGYYDLRPMDQTDGFAYVCEIAEELAA